MQPSREPSNAPPRNAPRRAVLAAAGAALVAGAGAAWWQQAKAPASDLADDEAALWQAQWPTPAGGLLSMAALRSSGLVLNFWASWCPPCVREFPELDRFHQAVKSKGWRVLGLAADSMPAVSSFLQKHPVSFDIAVSGIEGLTWSRRLGNAQGGLPFTVIFNPGGSVRGKLLGETSFDHLMKATGLA